MNLLLVRGMAKYFNFAINKAKKIGITPLILQTNSLDHPNALMFYQKMDFKSFKKIQKLLRVLLKMKNV